ncbi:MAG: hypothetical protein ACREJ2_08275 [Planctomycetota bacterium]
MGRTWLCLCALALIVSGCGSPPTPYTGEQASVQKRGLEIPADYAALIRKKYPHAEMLFYFERRKKDAESAYCTFYTQTPARDPKKDYGVIYFDPKTRHIALEMSRILVREAADKVVDKFREDYPDFRIWQMYRVQYARDNPTKPGAVEYQFWALDDKSMMVVSYNLACRRTMKPYLFDGADFHFIPPTSLPSEVSNGLYHALGYTPRYGAAHMEVYGDKVYKIYTTIPEDLTQAHDLPGSFRRRELCPRLPVIVMVDSKGNLIDTYFGYDEN